MVLPSVPRIEALCPGTLWLSVLKTLVVGEEKTFCPQDPFQLVMGGNSPAVVGQHSSTVRQAHGAAVLPLTSRAAAGQTGGVCHRRIGPAR